MAGRPSGSGLTPHRDEILAWRRKRPPATLLPNRRVARGEARASHAVGGDGVAEQRAVRAAFLHQPDAGGLARKNLLLLVAPGCSGCRVPAHGTAEAFPALVPLQVIGALGVALLAVTDDDVVRFDTTVGGNDDGTVAQSLRRAYSLGEVDVSVHWCPKPPVSVSPTVLRSVN